MKNLIALIGLIFLLGFGGASVWFDLEADDMVAPNRLFEGPDETVYVQAFNKVYVLSSEGRVLKTWDIKRDLEIHEPIADIYVDQDGKLLVGLMETQLIRIYSPEGRYIRDHLREPSPITTDDRLDFRFTKDPANGKLYVSDTFRHQIQVYDEFGKQVERYGEFSGETLRFPVGVSFKDGRLYISDRDRQRIVIIDENDGLEKIVPLKSLIETKNTYPLRVSLKGEKIALYSRARLPLPGQDIHIILPNALEGTEFKPEQSMRVYNDMGIDFADVLARSGDILVADPNLMKILRYSPYGEAMGEFGEDGLGLIFSDLKKKKNLYNLLHIGFLGGALLILLGLLGLVKKKQKI